MTTAFYVFGAIAFLATALAITRPVVVHSLLYLVVSFLGMAGVFFTLGAPFVAALEVIIYAGAIVVLFLFVVMTLNFGTPGNKTASQALNPKYWIGPSVLSGILLFFLLRSVTLESSSISGKEIDAKQVGISLFTTYLLETELSSMLLLAGLIGAFHLGRRQTETP